MRRPKEESEIRPVLLPARYLGPALPQFHQLTRHNRNRPVVSGDERPLDPGTDP